MALQLTTDRLETAEEPPAVLWDNIFEQGEAPDEPMLEDERKLKLVRRPRGAECMAHACRAAGSERRRHMQGGQ